AAGGEYVEFEADIAQQHGESYAVEGVFRPVTSDDGTVVSLIVSARDVTERKQRESELERYKAYLDGSSDSITVLDESGVIQYQSPSITRILGYSPGELVGESGFDIVHPDDRDALFETFSDLVSNPSKTVTAEARCRTANDEWRWLEVRGTNYRDHALIDGIVINNRDITERKRRERDLEQTNALLSTLFEALPVGVLAEDESRRVVRANQQLSDLFDLPGTPEDFVGDDCAELAEDISDMFAEPDAFVTRIDELVSGSEPVRNEEMTLRDGRTFVRSYHPIELSDGGGHLWVYRDITESKQRETRLEALNETTQDLMAAETRSDVAEIGASAALEVLGMDANAVHLYDADQSALVPRAVTDAGYELIGEPPAFTEGDSIAWRVYESGESLALDDVHEDPDITNPNSPVRSEILLPIGDYGILIAGSDTPAAFDQQDLVFGELLAGNIAAALGQVEQTEALRDREAELMHQNDRLEEFASVVSHDLRNPLQVAEGQVRLLREGADSDTERVAAIDRALTRMDTLIGDLLTLARQGERVQELEAVDLAALVEDCWQTVDTAGATVNIETTRTVRADRSRLQQLFENLVRNAIEHGGNDVTVTIDDTASGFYVADDGPGIAAAQRERVFEAGYSTAQDGTGFGLAIVKEVVDAHGWEIAVTDSEAGGARFEITGVK
ncbi:MAG: PAS domain S-box-containing protein, partial [Natronomonas sp.]